MNPEKKNIEHSIRQQLLNISKQRKEDFQFCLTRYALERFLYRLSKSSHVNKFVLKGALLLMSWTQKPYRPTRDLDLLGLGNPAPDILKNRVIEICLSEVAPDGLVFDTDSLIIEEIREELLYEGHRIKMMAYLGKVRIPLQIDIAFGDAISPNPETIKYPTLLELPPAYVLSYPKETVVAEKLQAAVALGIRNSRMKDFFDLFWLSRLFHFDSKTLVKAIQATFKRRTTVFPTQVPFPLTEGFASDPAKRTQWGAFLRKNDISHMPAEFEKVISELNSFLVLPLKYSMVEKIFDKVWQPGGPWE
ncbi:MAG: nucleotidyl transferase AbiEii/AbiGii toxin family protein [Deltaproteobacteria bacterium]|nr:nucleotidyl transferase AbiEii/AbiGii toxin family protein [Deltaproteobacteria bacterium]